MWQKNRIDNIDSYDALELMMLITEKLSQFSESTLSLTTVWREIKNLEA